VLAQRGGGEVEGELREEGDHVDRPVVAVRRSRRGDHEHERGPQREPGVAERHQQPARRAPTDQRLGQLAERQPGGNAQRHGLRRQDEEHRHEHELQRDGVGGTDLEGDPRGDRQSHDGYDGVDHDEVATVVGGEQESE
jgi:hypothetical protein